MPHAHHARRAGHLRRPYVGGEYLDGSEAVLYVLVQGLQKRGRDFPQQHQMVGIVGVGVALPDRGALLNGLTDVDARVLDGEIHQRRGAAEKGGAAYLLGRGRLQVARPHYRRRDVRVGLDAPGYYDLAGGVDDPSHIIGQGAGGGHRDDFLSLHRHIPIPHSPRGDYFSASNNQVQHISPSFIPLTPCSPGAYCHNYPGVVDLPAAYCRRGGPQVNA